MLAHSLHLALISFAFPSMPFAIGSRCFRRRFIASKGNVASAVEGVIQEAAVKAYMVAMRQSLLYA